MIAGAKLTLPDGNRDHIQGSLDAPIALVEYGDYECPFCGEVYLEAKRSSALWAIACALHFATSR